MELMEKQGFKQTEVGLIPVDWDIKKLDALSVRIGDGIHTTPKYNSSGNYYFVNGNNLINGVIEISDDNKRVSEDEYLIHKRNLDNSTVLLSINGTIGNIAFYNGEKIVLGKSAAYLNLNSKIYKRLIYYLIQSEFIKRYFDNELTGSTIKNLGLSSIRNTPIPLPPTFEEQKAIATALSDVDELITNLDQLITKKKAIKQGAMQQLLTPPHKGGKRLEGFTGEWEEKTLGELFDFKTTTTKKQFFDLSGNLIVMDMGSVSIDGKILRSKKASCDFDILKKGDLVMPKDDIGGGNIIGKVAYIDKDNSYVLSDHVFRLNSINDKINSLYFYYLINSRIVNESILKVVSGSAQLGLGLNAIKKITVCYNSYKSQQKAIAQILSDMDLEIERLETKKEKFQYIKLGMMQELLTGKTRLI